MDMQRNRYGIRPPKQIFKAFVVFLSIMLLVAMMLRLAVEPEETLKHVPLSSEKIRLIEDEDGNGKISKGDQINICDLDYDENGKNDLFRVMDVDGNKYKLLAIDSVYSSGFSNSYKMKNVNGKYISKYEISNIDNFSKLYFQSLPEEIQQAIVPVNIKQSIYQFTYGDDEITKKCEGKYLQLYEDTDTLNEVYNISQKMNLTVNKIDETEVGERYVYAPDMDDIQEYFDDESYTTKEFRTAFFDKSSKNTEYIATRSAIDEFPDRIGVLNNVTGNYADLRSNVTVDFHPEFVIEIQN